MVKFNLLGISLFLSLVWAFATELSSIFVNFGHAFLASIVIIIGIGLTLNHFLTF